MYSDELKIPKDRIGVLLGVKGAEKRRLQKKARVHITVDSKTGDVSIDGENSVDVFNIKPVIKAIGRGFNPDIAEKLLNEEYSIEIIDIENYCRKTKNDICRVRSRLIGTQGKARMNIERLTNTNIVVYGKTVSIIGKYENVDLARQAMINLLNGSPHSHVYRFVEMKHKDKKNGRKSR